jgi:3-dehydroquinate dehydratase type I
MICVSLKGNSIKEILSKIETLYHEDVLIEIRLDYIKDIHNIKLIRPHRNRLILTFRDNNLSIEKKLDIYRLILSIEPKFIDVDIHDEIVKYVIESSKQLDTLVILSYHNYEETPTLSFIKSIEAKAVSMGGDILKVATYANKLSDNLIIFEFIISSTIPVIAFCMGKLGKISRIFSTKFGSILTYASISKEDITGPGQIPYPKLKAIWGMIDED